MSLPITIFASPQGNVLKGIIYEIKETYRINDPIASNIVTPSTIGNVAGDAKNLIFWNAQLRTTRTTGSWFQLTFPGRHLFPTAYSLKGPTRTGSCYAKSWDVYGIHEGDENKEKEKWDLLGSNDTSQSEYCYNQGPNCNSLNKNGTYTLKPLESNIGYKHKIGND